MKEEKGVAGRMRVFGIELFDALLGQLQERFVFRHGFRGGVTKIGEQAKMEMLIPIGQEADFQGIDQFPDTSSLVSMVGTTTRVRNPCGIPFEKSMRGSGRGVASKVASQLTRATARWLALSTASRPTRPSIQPCMPSSCALPAKNQAKTTVSSRMEPL
jgi:hypothetical protein